MKAPPSTPEERDLLRGEIAKANGFELYKRYTEAEAASFLRLHPQTLKETRLKGRITYLRFSPRNIAYFGLHIADYFIEAIEWQNPTSPSTDLEKSGSRAAMAAKPSTDIGGTQNVDAQDALRLAQKILKKPSRD